MRLFRPFAIMRRFISDNADLIGLGWALACAQTVVPLGHFFANPDGAAWMTLSVSAAAAVFLWVSFLLTQGETVFGDWGASSCGTTTTN